MKPFNLEAALNGAKVVTRAGLEAKCFAYNSDCAGTSGRVSGWVGNTLLSWSEDGRAYATHESCCDLFLAPQTREGWINIYEDDCNCPERGCIYPMKESAESAILDNGDYKHIATIRIEWEE